MLSRSRSISIETFTKVKKSTQHEFSQGREDFACWAARPRSVSTPKGYLPVYVGDEGKRYLIKAKHLHNPLIVELLDRRADKYGYSQSGALQIECDEEVFESILWSAQHQFHRICLNSLKLTLRLSWTTTSASQLQNCSSTIYSSLSKAHTKLVPTLWHTYLFRSWCLCCSFYQTHACNSPVVNVRLLATGPYYKYMHICKAVERKTIAYLLHRRVLGALYFLWWIGTTPQTLISCRNPCLCSTFADVQDFLLRLYPLNCFKGKLIALKNNRELWCLQLKLYPACWTYRNSQHANQCLTHTNSLLLVWCGHTFVHNLAG